MDEESCTRSLFQDFSPLLLLPQLTLVLSECGCMPGCPSPELPTSPSLPPQSLSSLSLLLSPFLSLYLPPSVPPSLPLCNELFHWLQLLHYVYLNFKRLTPSIVSTVRFIKTFYITNDSQKLQLAKTLVPAGRSYIKSRPDSGFEFKQWPDTFI